MKEGLVSQEQQDDNLSIDQIYIIPPQYAEYSHAKFPVDSNQFKIKS